MQHALVLVSMHAPHVILFRDDAERQEAEESTLVKQLGPCVWLSGETVDLDSSTGGSEVEQWTAIRNNYVHENN